MDEANESIYAYVREDPTIGEKLLVILNMSRGSGRGEEVNFTVPSEVDVSKAKLLISNGPEKEGAGLDQTVKLGPFEGRIYLL